MNLRQRVVDVFSCGKEICVIEEVGSLVKKDLSTRRKKTAKRSFPMRNDRNPSTVEDGSIPVAPLKRF